MKWILALLALLGILFGGLYLMVQPLPGSPARDAIGTPQTLESGGATLVWYELGTGPAVVMFASAGREASDFNELAETVAGAGHQVFLVEAPGINQAVASKPEPTLFDLAEDLRPLINRIDGDIVFLGHAFGNRLARTAATVYNDRTHAVILLAAGGKRDIPRKANAALRAVFNPFQSREVRMANIRYAFFAGDNDIPPHWVRGWHIETATLQGQTRTNTDTDAWWAGGTAPMLVISGLQDTIAPPEDTIDLLEAEFPERITAVRLDGAGHALLPEQPALITSNVLQFLTALKDPETDP